MGFPSNNSPRQLFMNKGAHQLVPILFALKHALRSIIYNDKGGHAEGVTTQHIRGATTSRLWGHTNTHLLTECNFGNESQRNNVPNKRFFFANKRLLLLGQHVLSQPRREHTGRHPWVYITPSCASRTILRRFK